MKKGSQVDGKLRTDSGSSRVELVYEVRHFFWKVRVISESSHWLTQAESWHTIFICVASLLWAIKSFLLPRFCFLLFNGKLKCFPCKPNLEAVGKVIMNPVLHCTNHLVSRQAQNSNNRSQVKIPIDMTSVPGYPLQIFLVLLRTLTPVFPFLGLFYSLHSCPL